jgi:RNA polymerase sigma-70 factor (ECF subfamily)
VVSDSADELIRLYETTVDDVYRYASRLTGGDRARTDELVQETYLGVLRRLRRGDHLQLSAGYLVVACRSRFLDELKATRRRDLREQRTAVDRPPSTPPHDEPGLATEALALLPADQRAALVMRYIDDLAVPDVARHLGRSVHATESLLARARAALRTILQQGAES